MKDMRFKFKQWAIRNKENLPNKKHQAFLTIVEYKKDILALLKEGFKIKAIYRYLSEVEKISCSYSTFRIHVNNLIQNQLDNNGSIGGNGNLNNNFGAYGVSKSNATCSKRNALSKNDSGCQNKTNKNPSNQQESAQTNTPIIAKAEPIPRFKHNSVPRSSEEIF